MAEPGEYEYVLHFVTKIFRNCRPLRIVGISSLKFSCLEMFYFACQHKKALPQLRDEK